MKPKHTFQAVVAEILKELDSAPTHFEEIIGNSKSLEAVREIVVEKAATNAPILITGKVGTGKEQMVRALHQLSPQRHKPMISVDCSSLPDLLLDEELFGTESGTKPMRKGRFELSHKGIIFLREISDLPFSLQYKLMRALEDGEISPLGSQHKGKVSVRILATSTRDLVEAMAHGTFREDLFHRLNLFTIKIPALRERPEDIPLLVNYFLKKISAHLGISMPSVDERVLTALKSYHWPGNLPQLRSTLEQAMLQANGNVLSFGDWIPSRETTPLEELERVYQLELKTLRITEIKKLDLGKRREGKDFKP